MSDLFEAAPYPFEEVHNHGEAAMKVKRDQFKYKAKNAIPCPFCGGESVSVNHSEIRYLGQNAIGVKKAKMRAYCVCNKSKATLTGKHKEIPLELAIKYYIQFHGASSIVYQQYPKKDHGPMTLEEKIREYEIRDRKV